MKYLYWIILITSLTMISCRKESLIPIDETETEEPTELEGLYFRGVIADKKTPIANAQVEVYQNEKLVGTQTSGPDGSFNTAGLKLEAGKHVTFYVKHKDYPPKAKRVTTNEKSFDLGILKLSPPDLMPAMADPLENPGSNDLIIVSGYVKTPQGEGVKAAVLLLYDIVETDPSNYETKGEGVETDETGYYEVLLPKNQEFYYFAFQEGCVNKLLTQSQVVIFQSIPAQVVGPYTEDTVLPTLSNGVKTNDVQRKVGFIIAGLDCNGSFIQNGGIKGTVTIGSESFPLEFNAQSGIYFPYKEYCVKEENGDAPIELRFRIFDYANNKSSEELVFENVGFNDNLGATVACTSPLTDKPYMSFTLGGKAYIFEMGKGTLNPGDTLYSTTQVDPQNGLLQFLVPQFSNGGTAMKNLRFQASLVDGGFNYEQRAGDNIVIAFEASGNPKIIPGTFQGQISNELGIPFPVTGKFRVILP